MMFSVTPSLDEMLTLIVDEMLAILPSSKLSRVGMGLLNQSKYSEGIKSLDSILY